jgi:hypothetical protein
MIKRPRALGWQQISSKGGQLRQMRRLQALPPGPARVACQYVFVLLVVRRVLSAADFLPYKIVVASPAVGTAFAPRPQYSCVPRALLLFQSSHTGLPRAAVMGAESLCELGGGTTI